MKLYQKHFFISIAVAGVLFFAYSCNTSEKSQRVSEIDSLLSIAQDLNNTADSIQLDSIDTFYKRILDQNKIFKKKLNGLPDNIEIRDKLFAYGNVEKGFKKLPSKLKSLVSEIATSIEQLNNLRHDISNDLLEEEEFNNYISEEKEILDRLNTEINQVCKTLKMHIENYDNLKFDVELYVDSLKTTEDKI